MHTEAFQSSSKSTVALVYAIATFLFVAVPFASAQDNVIDFESAEIGKPMLTWSEKDVIFTPAHEPEKSKAKGRIMFFPHLGTDRKGIVNAIANEAIPFRVTFPRPVNKAELILWGSTTSSALVEAFDAEGNLLTKDSLDHVPVRKSPEELVPFFELTVSAEGISNLVISGAKPGGFVAVDKLTWNYVDDIQPVNLSGSKP